MVEEDGKWGVGPNGVLPVMSLRDTCTTNLALSLSLSLALSLALSLFLAFSYHKRQLTLGKNHKFCGGGLDDDCFCSSI